MKFDTKVVVVLVIIVGLNISYPLRKTRPGEASLPPLQFKKEVELRKFTGKGTPLTCLRNLFDASKIEKYFKDQVGCAKRNEFKFIDESFTKLSNENKVIKIEFSMESPEKMFPNGYDLFDSKIEMNDLNQGAIGDCYFVSTIASLADYPSQIYNKFKNYSVSKNGCYEIALFIEGEWNIVIVDDLIPLRKVYDKYYNAFVESKRNLWPILLEKAWAKVNGGYDKIDAGYPSDSFTVLTGVPSKDLEFLNVDKDEVWKQLLIYKKQGNLICANSFTSRKMANETFQKLNGLIEGHAYTLLGAYETDDDKSANTKLKLVKLRNPWGNKEWKGKMSDNDEEFWTKDRLKGLSYTIIKDDGVFFIEYNQFLEFFSNVSLCSFHSNLNIKYLKFEVEKSLDTAPRYYKLNVKSQGNLGLSAVTVNARFYSGIKVEPIQLRIFLAQEKNNSFNYLEGNYNTQKDVSILREVSEGTYVFMVWYEYNSKNLTRTVKLTISMDSEFTISEKFIDGDLSILRSILAPAFLRFDLIELTKEKDYKISYTSNKLVLFMIPNENSFESKSKKCFRITTINNETTYCYSSDSLDKALPLSFQNVSQKEFAIYVVPHNENLVYQKYQPYSISNSNTVIEYSNSNYTYTTGCLSQFQPISLTAGKHQRLKLKYSREIELLESLRLESSSLFEFIEIITNENIYVGQVNKEKRPEGLGFQRSKLNNGKSSSEYPLYIGQWKDGLKDGQGKEMLINTSNGEVKVEYEGIFSYGLRSVEGTIKK